MNYEELVGKYINGFFIEKVEKDPFIEGQINLYTDSKREDFLGNQAIVKFYITDYSMGASVYQEQVDKENYKLKSIIKEVREKINNFDVFKEFTFPLMKREEENQVKSSIDYEWRKSIKEPLLKILDRVGVDKEC